MTIKGIILVFALLSLSLFGACSSDSKAPAGATNAGASNATPGTTAASTAPPTFTKHLKGRQYLSGRHGDTPTETTVRLTMIRNGSNLSGTLEYTEYDGGPQEINGSIDDQLNIKFVDKIKGRTNFAWEGKFTSPTEIDVHETSDSSAKREIRAKETLEKPPATTTASLDDQAANEIRNMFEKVYAKCGDSYYSKGDSSNPGFVRFTQLREVAFKPMPRQITETDNLNGVEWAGRVYVISRFHRGWMGGRWYEYSSGGEMQLNARKVRGNWELDTDFLFLNRGSSKPNCSEVPKD